jgi:hypothetical protein
VFIFFGNPADLEMRFFFHASSEIILASLLWSSEASNTLVVVVVVDDCDKDVSVMVTRQGSSFLL